MEVNYLEEVSYECGKCGKKIKTSEGKIPVFCNKSMNKINLDICNQPGYAEHSRPMGEEDLCDDFRSG